MGQEISVSARPGASPSVRLFSINRSLTGMGIERYASVDDARGNRPPDVLARRLLELGAERVTVYSSDVVVEAPPARWGELESVAVATIEHLLGFYGDDAGWSDERLRAMGIEPYPRPEPEK